jgi:hypothetical protein
MSLLAIFVYGAFVSAIVAAALGLLAWGIVNERRDRRLPEQGREVFGARAAQYIARDPDGRVEEDARGK